MSSLTPIAVDRATGEVTKAATAPALLNAYGLAPIGEADTSQLAMFTEDIAELRRVAKEAVGIVSDELIARLDADARWTLRVGQWEIKAASPEAGSVSYDVDLLQAAMNDLIDAGVISHEGARSALERVPATIEVSYRLLRDVLRVLDGFEDSAGIFSEIEQLLLTEPEPTYKLKLTGVKALLKIPRARQAIEACQIPATPPRRVAKVTRVAR